jgi:hypothetical protein
MFGGMLMESDLKNYDRNIQNHFSVLDVNRAHKYGFQHCKKADFKNEHEFGAYLRNQSGDNDWTWKAFPRINVFFSSKGKWIATCFYHGKNNTETTTYIPKDIMI